MKRTIRPSSTSSKILWRLFLLVTCFSFSFLIFLGWKMDIYTIRRLSFRRKSVKEILNVKLKKNDPYLSCHPNQRLLELDDPSAAFVFDVYKYYPGNKIAILMMSYYYVDREHHEFIRPPYQMKVTFVSRYSNNEETAVCVLNDCDLYEKECMSNIHICKIPSDFQSKKSISIKFEKDKNKGSLYEVQDCSRLPKYEYSISVMMENSVPYIDEWMKYNHFIGFEHVYLYCIRNEDRTCQYADEKFGDYVTTFIVDNLPYAIGAQFFTFADAAYRYRKNSWIALHDVDEFPVYLPNLREFTSPYNVGIYSSLQIRQVMYDSEGYDKFHMERNNDGEVEEKFSMLRIFHQCSSYTGLLFLQDWRYEERRSKVMIKPSKSLYGGIHMYCSEEHYKTKSIEVQDAYFNHYWGKKGNRKLEFPNIGDEKLLEEHEGLDYFEVISSGTKDIMLRISNRYAEILESCEDNNRNNNNGVKTFFCSKREEELKDPSLMKLKKKKNIVTKKVYDQGLHKEEEMREFTCPKKYCCPENGDYVSSYEDWERRF